MTKTVGSRTASGSIGPRHGSPDPDPDPDALQNLMDPQHCFQGRTSTVDVEISTAVLLSGMALDAVHSFLTLLRIATNHQTTVYRFLCSQ
jgi:hypothetical protein